MRAAAFVIMVGVGAAACSQAEPPTPAEDVSVDLAENRVIYELPVTQLGDLKAGQPLVVTTYLSGGEQRSNAILTPNQPITSERPAREYLLASTFYVDHHEPSVIEITDEFIQQRDQDLSLALDLKRFVGAAFTDSNDQGGIAVASQVASTRAGDCTEYAVLVAAMARRLGVPAQVVMGVVVVMESGQAKAYGHAWAELETESGWVVVDAALASMSVNQLYYLADYPVTSEGVSYQWDFMTQFMSSGISKIEIAAVNK